MKSEVCHVFVREAHAGCERFISLFNQIPSCPLLSLILQQAMAEANVEVKQEPVDAVDLESR